MKYRLFRSQKFRAVFIFVVIVSGLLAIFQNRNTNRLPEIFNYVPVDSDQVMINWPAQNLKNNSNSMVGIPQGVQAQFMQINTLIIAQKMSFTSGEQMLFLSTKTDFSPQEFLNTLNPENDTLYTYLRLDDGLYLFAPQNIIQSYIKPTLTGNFFSQSKLCGYKSLIKDNSLTMISRNSKMLYENNQLSSLVKNVDFLIFAVNSSAKKTELSSYILFTTGHQFKVQPFKPLFSKYFQTSTIAYLEIGNIIDSLNIDTSELFPQTSGENAAQTFVVSQILNKIFSQHIAIVISKGSNMTNLGLSIFFESKDVYSSLEPLIPMIAQRLQNQPMLTGSTFVQYKQPGKIGYDITIQDTQKIGLYLEQTDDGTKITFGNPLIEGDLNDKINYNPNSIAALKIDMNQVISLYKQAANIGIMDASLINQQDFFNQLENKTFYANIDVDTQKISLKGEIK